MDSQRHSAENFGDLLSIESLTQKDINNLATGYTARTTGDGRMFFGLARTKCLKALIHWMADFGRIGFEHTREGLDQESFHEGLRSAAQRAEIRTSEDDCTDTRTK